MGTILDNLSFGRTYRLPEKLLSGITFDLKIDNEGDILAFDFLGHRYEDAGLIADNIIFQPINDDDDSDVSPFPRIYKIDASACLLAYFSGDTGLNSLANESLRASISELMVSAFHKENNVLDEITLDCSDDFTEPELSDED